MLIKKGDVDGVGEMLELNPLILVTSADTPTLLQVNFKFFFVFLHFLVVVIIIIVL